MSDVRKPKYPLGPAKFGQSGWYDLPAPASSISFASIICSAIWWLLVLAGGGYTIALIISNLGILQ